MQVNNSIGCSCDHSAHSTDNHVCVCARECVSACVCVQAGAAEAYGLDLAQTACTEAEAHVRASGLSEDELQRAHIVCADFFEWQDPQGSGFDVAYDYTFG